MDELLSILRITYARDRSVFKMIESKYDNDAYKVPILSMWNEKNVFAFLKQAFEKAKNKYPNSLEHDLRMVNDQNLPKNIFNSLQITILEKQVIESLRQWST